MLDRREEGYSSWLLLLLLSMLLLLYSFLFFFVVVAVVDIIVIIIIIIVIIPKSVGEPIQSRGVRLVESNHSSLPPTSERSSL